MLTPMLPTVVMMFFGWWTILDTHRKLLSVKLNSVAVFDKLKVRLAPTTIPCSKALQCFVLPIHPLSDRHTQSMSQLFQGLKILL